MSVASWLSMHLGLANRPTLRRRTAAPGPRFRPVFEELEQRRVLSTLTVLNNHDSGTGSLRAAIAAAHKGDTIIFASSLNGQTIALTSGEVLLKKDVTISGPGANELTISGSNTSRVFELSSTTKPQVSLSGLTISNGAANGPNTTTIEGGGIYNHGTLTISNCTFTNNHASNNGGAIANDLNATLTVNGSTLSSNSSSSGGGISNYGTLAVNGSTISGNTAGSGGGIWSTTGTMVVSSSSTLSDNSAGRGGGMYVASGIVQIQNSMLTSNHANTYGGAIYNYAGSLTLTNSILSSNSVGDSLTFTIGTGGGIFDYQGTVLLSGCTLSSNSAIYAGGGIYVSANATVTVKDSSTVTGNSAPPGLGADVYNLGLLQLASSDSIIGILDGNAPVPL